MDDTRLELVTSRTSSGCATTATCALTRAGGFDFTTFSSSYFTKESLRDQYRITISQSDFHINMVTNMVTVLAKKVQHSST